MKLSTVICNYNTRAELERALNSLAVTDAGLAHEVIVVDNASPDGSAAMVRERFPAVRLIEAGANRWFSGGNNLGLRAARGEYALILNPDTIMQLATLQTLVAYLDAHPAVGGVTPRQYFPDGTLQHNCSRLAAFPDLLADYTLLGVLLPGWRARRRRAMWYDDWDRTTTRPVEVAPGSCLMARRALLAQVDYFDERLKLFFTDDDLCRKLIGIGAAVHYVAEAAIIHDEHTSLKQVPRLSQRIYWQDLRAYARKVYGRAAAGLLVALLVPTQAGMALKRRARG